MVRIALSGTTLLGLSLLCPFAFARQKANSGSEAEQVWAGEEAYWRYVKAHDIKSYLALWSEDFTGWPIADQHPIRKAEIAAFATEKGGLAHAVSYELRRESVEMYGPVGITFYRAAVRRDTSGSESTTTYRMTHTWMKRGDAWKIVSGMSAMDMPSAPSSAR